MIGKTRQAPAPEIEEVSDPEVGKARGILRRPLPAGKCRHSRRRPATTVASWIAHYWMVSWDLTGCGPHVVESLPHPNVHAIFENNSSVICGVQTGKFSRVLKGRSQVFGIKFRPGGFRPFLDSPVSELTNRMVPANHLFGNDVKKLEAVLLSSEKEDTKVEAADAFFRMRVPEPAETALLAGHLVERILHEPEIKTVDDLVSRAGIGKRSLQRIFNEYVGVSPKWVIRRYRLHELIEKLNSRDLPNLTQVALEMGYFDQSHLINDFKSMVGYAPTQHLRLLTRRS
jgi:AraC-like DNA-binding protein